MYNTPWTDKEIKTVKRTDISGQAMADMTGRSLGAIYTMRNRLKTGRLHTPKTWKKWTPGEVQFVRKSTLSDEELAEQLGRTVASVFLKRRYG